MGRRNYSTTRNSSRNEFPVLGKGTKKWIKGDNKKKNGYTPVNGYNKDKDKCLWGPFSIPLKKGYHMKISYYKYDKSKPKIRIQIYWEKYAKADFRLPIEAIKDFALSLLSCEKAVNNGR